MDTDHAQPAPAVDPWDAALLGGSVAQTASSMYVAQPSVSTRDVSVPFPPPPMQPPVVVPPSPVMREKTGIPRDIVPRTSSPQTDYTRLSIKPTPLMQTRPNIVPPPPRPAVMPRVEPPTPIPVPVLKKTMEQAAVVDLHVPTAVPQTFPVKILPAEPMGISTDVAKVAVAVLAIPLFIAGFMFADVAKYAVARVARLPAVANLLHAVQR